MRRPLNWQPKSSPRIGDQQLQPARRLSSSKRSTTCCRRSLLGRWPSRGGNSLTTLTCQWAVRRIPASRKCQGGNICKKATVFVKPGKTWNEKFCEVESAEVKLTNSVLASSWPIPWHNDSTATPNQSGVPEPMLRSSLNLRFCSERDCCAQSLRAVWIGGLELVATPCFCTILCPCFDPLKKNRETARQVFHAIRFHAILHQQMTTV